MDENKNEKVEKNVTENSTNNDDVLSSYEPKDVTTTSYEPDILNSSYENPSVSTEENKKTKKEKKTNGKKGSAKVAIIVIVLIAIIVAAAIAIYFLVFAKTTIDLSEHINIKYSGFDGTGTAVSAELKSSLKNEFDDSSVYKKFKKKAELEITSDDYGTLKNGDTIKVKVDISKSWLDDNKIELKDKTIKVKVSGLPEAEKIDVFEDIDITVSGISPNLSVSIESNSDNEFIRDCVYYYADESYDLEDGDEITITASYSTYDAKEYGVIVEEDTMEYTVEANASYIDDKKDFTEDLISELNNEMIEKVSDTASYSKYNVYSHNSNTISYSSDLVAGEPELINLYLLTPKDKDSYYSYDNLVYGIYKVTYTSTETGAKFDWYFLSYESDIAVTKDGELYEDDYGFYFYTYDDATKEELYTDYIEYESSDYTITTVK